MPRLNERPHRWKSAAGSGAPRRNVPTAATRTGRTVRSPARVGAVVLAAGRSTRAGDVNKLLHPVAGESMIRRVVRRVLASDGIDDVVVVTGHEHERVVDALADLAVTFTHNDAYARGMAGSLARGIDALDGRGGGRAGALVCLGDMPGIATTTFERVVGTWRATVAAAGNERVVAVPSVNGRRGNPVLIGRVFFDLVLALEGDVGARHILRAHPDAVHEVAVDDGAILIDHDTQDELRRLDDR